MRDQSKPDQDLLADPAAWDKNAMEQVLGEAFTAVLKRWRGEEG